MQNDEVLLNDWDAEVLNESINRTEKKAAREEGIRVGEAKGEAKERKNLIENMFKNGLEIPLISKITGTSINQLNKIKTNIRS